MQETWVRSLGWEDPLEEEMATHSSVLAWDIPWTEELGGLQSMGSHRVGHDLAHKHIPLVRETKRDGNPCDQPLVYTFFYLELLGQDTA